MDQRNPARAAPQNRSFIVGEFAKSLDVVYIDAFASCGQHAALLPPGEQAAYGKQSRAGHLRQHLAGKVDLERSIPVYATPQLVKQAQQLMTQPCRHLFRGNLAVTLLEFFEALCSHFYDIALQRGEALCQGMECAGLPDQGGGSTECLCRGAVTTLGGKPRYLYHVTRPCEPENNLRAMLTESHEFGATGSQKDDVADGIAFQEDGDAAREFALARRGYDFPAVGRGNTGEQRGVLNQRHSAQRIAFPRRRRRYQRHSAVRSRRLHFRHGLHPS